ncbi:MAG: hypothetical protein ABI171_15625, partial [Collimonas sp.]|uniref:hypothetical protein n=1 Tax=Collimonas sp. TaxID=1963772 RepID=UPI003265171F
QRVYRKMTISLRAARIFVPQDSPYREQVHASIDKLAGGTVPQVMKVYVIHAANRPSTPE